MLEASVRRRAKPRGRMALLVLRVIPAWWQVLPRVLAPLRVLRVPQLALLRVLLALRVPPLVPLLVLDKPLPR